jgi:phage tail sheath protein FI
MAFLHGIEHLNLPADFAPVNDVVTAVIGLAGTADQGETNVLTLCKSAEDDKNFGTQGTIPDALKAIRAQEGARGSALVFVVRVNKGETTEDTVTNIVGPIDENGKRTGLQLFETALPKFGFEPMIYIVPEYSAQSEVITALKTITKRSESMAYIDMIDEETATAAIAAKVSGTFSGLLEGQKLLFPQFEVGNKTVPMSAYAAGLRAKIDLEEGWHVSSSNHQINGVDGISVDLTFALGDLTCDANMLNEKGITTAVNMYGRGIVEWGNYSAGFPGNTNTEAFECVSRTRAIMKRTIQQACIPFIDKPFIKANVDAIRNTVNQYLNGLTSQGKIVYGQCFYSPESNPLNELTQGHLTFSIEFTPALPMQRLTFTYKIDLSQLSNIA